MEQNWLPGLLVVGLAEIGFRSSGAHANEAGVIIAADPTQCQDDIDRMRNKDQVFATIGYLLFTSTAS